MIGALLNRYSKGKRVTMGIITARLTGLQAVLQCEVVVIIGRLLRSHPLLLPHAKRKGYSTTRFNACTYVPTVRFHVYPTFIHIRIQYAHTIHTRLCERSAPSSFRFDKSKRQCRRTKDFVKFRQ